MKLSRRALRAVLPVLAFLALAPASAVAGSPGKAHFAKPAESSFDVFTKAPTSTQAAWMRDHYSRIRAYSPYFDTRLSWFSNAWVYQDAYAIYRGQEAGLENYILKDAGGNRLYIPFHCSGGTCTQYAADIGDPAWRQHFITRALARVALGYKGIFVDDVNLAFKVSDGNGNFVAPIDRRTGTTMTLDNWQRYFAEFMEQLRAALPSTFEIVHNQVYFHAGLTNTHVRRAIEAATHIEIERGVIDTGIVGGTGKYGFETVLAWAEYIHSRGKGVIWDAQSTWGREYQLATNFLVANGLDGFSHPEGSNPDNWWSGYDTDLGEPLGTRYSWNGVFRRDFQNGIVLVNQPGQTTKSLSLGGDYKTLAGSTISTLSLPTRDGAVLLHTTSSGPSPSRSVRAAGAPAVDRSTSSELFPAKLQVLRAGVRAGRLDVFARITGRASGRVDISYQSSGRTTRFTAPISNATIRVDRLLPASQRGKSTGILTMTYAGNDRVRTDEVRLRAATGKALLKRGTTRIDDAGRLRVAGTTSKRAPGVVRLRLGYTAADGSVKFLNSTAKITNGKWSLSRTLPADAAKSGGQLSIQYTGYETRRIRGEQLAKALAP